MHIVFCTNTPPLYSKPKGCKLERNLLLLCLYKIIRLCDIFTTKKTQIFDTNQKHQFYSLSFEDDHNRGRLSTIHGIKGDPDICYEISTFNFREYDKIKTTS